MAPLTLEALALNVVSKVAKAQEVPASQAVITLPSSPPTPSAPVSSASSAALDRAADELSRLREDLRSMDPRLVVGRLELASGWLHSDSAVRATLSQAAASSEKEKQSATNAAADREAALKDAKAARDR